MTTVELSMPPEVALAVTGTEPLNDSTVRFWESRAVTHTAKGTETSAEGGVKSHVKWSSGPLVETVSTSVFVSDPAVFAALIVTLKVPDCAGVPLMTPVPVLTVRPAGRPVAPKSEGARVAVI